ncbi:hypothetical protein BP5796_13183 [Coleophoma crateriformis]|uniref:Uncharacterized protein n=1 Tax=Coleophoma crateriformis TaxID=565419 RepID=A0A3D8Q4V6_9HELO|nr:hypothetical protein BP5796_13183 [Coleophoma crateriformis]
MLSGSNANHFTFPHIYQLAFLTPGKDPSNAFIRKLNCLEIPEDTSSLPSLEASVPNLSGAGVGVHLGQLQLGLGAGSRREAEVADDVPESLSSSAARLDRGSLGQLCMAKAGEEEVAPGGRIMKKNGKHTSLSHARRTPAVWYGRAGP